MSMCTVFPCVVGRGCLLWPVCSLGKTLLAFALMHSVLQGQICLLLQSVSWLSTFAFQSPSIPYHIIIKNFICYIIAILHSPLFKPSLSVFWITHSSTWFQKEPQIYWPWQLSTLLLPPVLVPSLFNIDSIAFWINAPLHTLSMYPFLLSSKKSLTLFKFLT